MVSRFLLVIGLAVCGSVVFAAPAPKIPDKLPIKELPDNVLKAWKTAGAEIGWMKLEPSQYDLSTFEKTRNLKEAPKELWLPAFQFLKWPGDNLSKLPVPETLFGLSIDNADEDDFELRKEHFAELKRFKTLAHLELFETKTTLEDIGVLKELKYLVTLTLESNAVTTKGLDSLKALSSLRNLVIIEDIADKDWEGIKVVTQITSLTIRNSYVGNDGLTSLGKLTGLLSLSIEDEDITDDGLKALKDLKKLKSLKLASDKITGAGIKEVAKLDQLRKLDLVLTSIDNDALKELSVLKDIEILNLGSENITDEGMQHLKGMTNLVELSLVATVVTDEGLKVVTNFSELRHLDLNGLVGVTDAGLKHLSGLKKLKWLDLGETSVSSKGLKSLAGKKLQHLELPEKLYRDANLKNYLNAIEVEKKLDLQGWNLTDSSIAVIAGYKDLEELDLRTSRKLTEKGLAPLLALTKLNSITLSPKVATANVKKEFAKTLPGCKVHVALGDEGKLRNIK